VQLSTTLNRGYCQWISVYQGCDGSIWIASCSIRNVIGGGPESYMREPINILSIDLHSQIDALKSVGYRKNTSGTYVDPSGALQGNPS
jgi:hypothetical protein